MLKKSDARVVVTNWLTLHTNCIVICALSVRRSDQQKSSLDLGVGNGFSCISATHTTLQSDEAGAAVSGLHVGPHRAGCAALSGPRIVLLAQT